VEEAQSLEASIGVLEVALEVALEEAFL